LNSPDALAITRKSHTKSAIDIFRISIWPVRLARLMGEEIKFCASSQRKPSKPGKLDEEMKQIGIPSSNHRANSLFH
jgi:hypothetical protein